MTIALADTFDVGNVIDDIPTNWSGSNTFWSVKAAPSWANLAVAQGLLYATTSQFLTSSSFTAIGNGYTCRARFGTDGANTERAVHIQFVNGATTAFSFFAFSDTNLYLSDMATTDVTMVTGYAANTLYDMQAVIGASGAITSSKINGVSKGGGTMAGSLTTINQVKFDNYNGGGTASGHGQIDLLLIDNSTAVPNGTLSATGTLDGHTLGPDNYGGVLLGYTNGTSPAATIYKLERSNDGGATYVSVGRDLLQTASGFLIWDGRLQYGTKTVSPGGTATYRVTASNATGDQVL